VTDQEKEWYTNKDLYEMMVDLSKGLENTNAELAKTQVLIREYNGLRARLDQCEQKFSELAGEKAGSHDTWGYIVGGFGLLMAIVSMAMR
jgi:tetrahydromethanopterin S-methyltransferase subunit G